jgi:hypothetical protein
MGKRLGRVLVFQALFVVVFTAAACNKSKKLNNDAVGQAPNEGGGPPMGMGGGPGRPKSPIGEIMVKLFGEPGRPQSLKDSIGRELNSASPPWESIQPQAKEVAQLTASLAKYDPPKGSKESWTRHTASLSETGASLASAAEHKNKTDALAAHGALSKSCMACHREHRGGPGGPGGMMRPGGFGPPGGPPGPPPGGAPGAGQ